MDRNYICGGFEHDFVKWLSVSGVCGLVESVNICGMDER